MHTEAASRVKWFDLSRSRGPDDAYRYAKETKC